MFFLVVLGLAAAAFAATITVTVGDRTLVYNPNNFRAARGDIISFQFLQGAHTVSQSAGVDRPCVQLEAGFDSGLTIAANGTQVWELVIEDDTRPIWFYCKQALHCQVGMAGVINAADRLIDSYIANAKLATDVQQTPQVSLKGVGASSNRAPFPAVDSNGTAPAAPSRSSRAGDQTLSTPPGSTPPTSPPTSLPVPSNPTSPTPAASDTRSATKLVLAIVVPAASLILAGSVVFVFLRRRRRRRYQVEQPTEGIIPYSIQTTTEGPSAAAPQTSKLDLAPGPLAGKSEPAPSVVSELRELHSAMQRAGVSVQTLLSSLRAPRDTLSEGSPPQYEA